MFNRPGTPWPEADITIVDLATFAREGYNAQLSIAYISPDQTRVNNIAERDQFLGAPSSMSPTKAISSPRTRCSPPMSSRSPRCGASWEPGSRWRPRT